MISCIDGASSYKNVDINWIPGADPELLLYNHAGQKISAVNLENYAYDGLQQLFRDVYKFVKKPKLNPADIARAEIKSCSG